MTDHTCSIDGCSLQVAARGWCHRHYSRWYKYGDPEEPIRSRGGRKPSEVDNLCEIDGCAKAVRGRGWCWFHYQRWYRYGDPLREPEPRQPCLVEGCKNLRCGHGYCPKHYKRFKKYGDPLKQTRPERGSGIKFVRLAAEYEGDDCLEWPYAKTVRGGYGAVTKSIHPSGKAHRAVLELAAGPPPEPGMSAAHAPGVCHNPACVNPRHLRWATNQENQADRIVDGTHGTKLSGADVVEIRRQFAEGGTTRRELANNWGISYGHIKGIISRRTWKHV